MMKLFKKLTLVTTTAFLFCLTIASGTLTSLSVPSIIIDTEEDAESTPLPQKPGIKPMSDGDEADNNRKTR